MEGWAARGVPAPVAVPATAASGEAAKATEVSEGGGDGEEELAAAGMVAAASEAAEVAVRAAARAVWEVQGTRWPQSGRSRRSGSASPCRRHCSQGSPMGRGGTRRSAGR